ncbi:hypothetical protein A5660_10665, partial [Mycobacterium alsense]
MTATSSGCTIAATAASNSVAAAEACLDASSAKVAAALNHPAYGAAEAAIAADAGPCHEPLASPEITAENDDAAAPSSPP